MLLDGAQLLSVGRHRLECLLFPHGLLDHSDRRHVCDFMIVIYHIRHLVTVVINILELSLLKEVLYTLFTLNEIISSLLLALIVRLVNV